MRKKVVNLNDRDRNHFAITYIPKERLDLLLKENLSLIRRYCYILHDRDFHLDGSPKEPHIHLWISFINKKSLRQLIDMLYVELEDGSKPNTLDELCDNNFVAQRYLLHLDNPEKAQYDIDEIVSFNVDLSNIFEVTSKGLCWEIDALSMLVNGESKFDVAKKYGRDFIYHYLQFKALANDIREEEFSRIYRERKSPPPDGELIDLITGEITLLNNKEEN